MARQLIVRGVSEEVGQRLEELSRARGLNVNATVLEILGAALRRTERRQRLSRYATWTPKDLAQFDKVLAAQRTIDESLWQ